MGDTDQGPLPTKDNDNDVPDAESIVADLIDQQFGDIKLAEEDNLQSAEDASKGLQEEDDSDDEGGQRKKQPSDDYVDEDKLKAEEVGLSEEQLKDRMEDAKALKDLGNQEYASEDYKGSILSYTKALLICPIKESELRAILYANRAASKWKLDRKDLAIDDCTSSLKHNPKYMKSLLRRAKLYEETDKLDEALADYKQIVELDPGNREARSATQRLPAQINERNEKLKTEMLGKLKDLGNMVLRPFGLSTENFQLQQDPNSGGYSINFKK